MKGNLFAKFTKGNQTLERKLSEDLTFTKKNGENSFLKGRSLMLIRNVGHLMKNPAILTEINEEVPETISKEIINQALAFTRNLLLNKFYIPNNLFLPRSRVVFENCFS